MPAIARLSLGNHMIGAGLPLAGQRVTLQLGGPVAHVLSGGVLAPRAHPPDPPHVHEHGPTLAANQGIDPLHYNAWSCTIRACNTSSEATARHINRSRTSAEVGSGEKITWMQPSEIQRALAAAMSTASALGLAVDDAIVLHDSNAVSVRLLPCDVVARVAPTAHQVAQFEVELARRLAETRSPVAALEPRVEPRVYERDGFVITLWTYYKPVAPREVSPAVYANALERLHAGHAQARCQDAALHRTSGRGSGPCGEQQPHSGSC